VMLVQVRQHGRVDAVDPDADGEMRGLRPAFRTAGVAASTAAGLTGITLRLTTAIVLSAPTAITWIATWIA